RCREGRDPARPDHPARAGHHAADPVGQRGHAGAVDRRGADQPGPDAARRGGAADRRFAAAEQRYRPQSRRGRARPPDRPRAIQSEGMTGGMPNASRPIMKSRTIAQRLYGFFALVMLALVGGFAAFMYADNLESQAIEAQTRAETLVGTLRLDTLQTSDALRGLMLDPTNRSESERKQAADEEFNRTADALKAQWQDKPEVYAALVAVLQQDDAKVNRAEAQVIEALARDRAAASTVYTTTLALGYREQSVLVAQLLEKIAAEDQREIVRARQARGIALAALVTIFVGAAIALFYLARSLSRPIRALNVAV